MSETRCDCCDLPMSMCGKATAQRLEREHRARVRELLARPDWFEARFPGACANCGEHFGVGEPISRNRDGLGWRADCCEAP